MPLFRVIQFRKSGMGNFPAGEWGRRQYREAEERVGDLTIGDSLRFALQMLFRELSQLRDYQREVFRKLRELAKSEAYKKAVNILRTAPGAGQVSSIRLALECGDVSRFKRKEEFAAFLGLDPSDYWAGSYASLMIRICGSSMR